mgnify:CR=1 FL=1
MIPNKGKVAVKFGAAWCSPCRSLGTILENNPLSIPLVEIDIDEHPELAQQYNVRGVPTMVLVQDGKEVTRKVGAQTIAQLQETFK